ncbi:MAG: accessory factor UbiK family protein [Pseudomonadales bacterium]
MPERPSINDFVRQLGEILPGPAMTEDLQKGLHSVVQSFLAKLDIVTREEFDAQQAVLLRTRAKVDELERLLAELSET